MFGNFLTTVAAASFNSTASALNTQISAFNSAMASSRSGGGSGGSLGKAYRYAGRMYLEPVGAVSGRTLQQDPDFGRIPPMTALHPLEGASKARAGALITYRSKPSLRALCISNIWDNVVKMDAFPNEQYYYALCARNCAKHDGLSKIERQATELLEQIEAQLGLPSAGQVVAKIKPTHREVGKQSPHHEEIGWRLTRVMNDGTHFFRGPNDPVMTAAMVQLCDHLHDHPDLVGYALEKTKAADLGEGQRRWDNHEELIRVLEAFQNGSKRPTKSTSGETFQKYDLA